MEKYGFGRIEKIATQTSVSSHFMSASGKESEPLHLIPSALLIVNLTPPPHNIMEAHRIRQFLEAHRIQQWWKPDLQLESKPHKYKC
jgi:hypothetical protein